MNDPLPVTISGEHIMIDPSIPGIFVVVPMGVAYAFVVMTVDAERVDVYAMPQIDADEQYDTNPARWRMIGSRTDQSGAFALVRYASGWSDAWLARMPLLSSGMPSIEGAIE